MGSLNLLIDCTYLKSFRQAVPIKLSELVSSEVKNVDENKKNDLQAQNSVTCASSEMLICKEEHEDWIIQRKSRSGHVKMRALGGL